MRRHCHLHTNSTSSLPLKCVNMSCYSGSGS